MSFSQIHSEPDDSGMMEYMAMEEQAFYTAVMEVKGFIDGGMVTYEQVEKILKGVNNGNHS